VGRGAASQHERGAPGLSAHETLIGRMFVLRLMRLASQHSASTLGDTDEESRHHTAGAFSEAFQRYEWHVVFLTTLAGVYIMIRGLDNISEGWKKSNWVKTPRGEEPGSPGVQSISRPLSSMSRHHPCSVLCFPAGLQRFRASRDDYDRREIARQANCSRTADAAARAGHDCNRVQLRASPQPRSQVFRRALGMPIIRRLCLRPWAVEVPSPPQFCAS
jgi:hypothetical protein